MLAAYASFSLLFLFFLKVFIGIHASPLFFSHDVFLLSGNWRHLTAFQRPTVFPIQVI